MLWSTVSKAFFKSTNTPAEYFPSSSLVWTFSTIGIRVLLVEKFNLNRIGTDSNSCFWTFEDWKLELEDLKTWTTSKKMNQDLKNLTQWLKANKLSLNIKKTELIIFHPKNTKLDYSVKFKLSDKRPNPISTVKYLGWNILRWTPVMDEASQLGKLKAESNNWNS